jgi:hypothetical protein
MYIDKMIVWITMRYTYIRKMCFSLFDLFLRDSNFLLVSQLLEISQSCRNLITWVYWVFSMKVIKVKDNTYQKLGEYGSWSDTMDSIIERLLERAEGSTKIVA